MQDSTVNSIPEDAIRDPIENVMLLTGLCRTSIYNLIKHDDFPQPYQFGGRAVRWKRAEVLAWMESRPRGTRIANTQRKKVAA